MSLLWRILGKGKGHDVDELARRLGVSADTLQGIRPSYREFTIPKRSGGKRRLAAPDSELKALQRKILQRVLSRLRVHPSVTGFEKGYSIVSNAACHVGRAVVVRMDIQDFFPSTEARRVKAYFRKIGWNREAAALLERLCTQRGGLPQGAPTSPRLSNLVNYGMDARLMGLAARHGAIYSRYADDLTFSFSEDRREEIAAVIRATKAILRDCGYTLHHKEKLHIRRRHQRQVVTGLTVNQRVGLPRSVRRWLRAVEHYAATGRTPTLSERALQGWRAYQKMIEKQRDVLR